MPYPGIPKDKETKMESCVEKVMKTGKSKGTAIAICRKSIAENDATATHLISKWYLEHESTQITNTD